MAVQELEKVSEEAAHCQRCPLYRHATQTVFGEGPSSATIMMIGEQPGDQEDRQGRPFVGPAGQVLDRALAEVMLDRRAVYVTNVVKHFKHEMRGKRRLHKHPNTDEIEKCRWWTDKEIAILQPKLIVALGTTAAMALTGRKIILKRERGRVLDFWEGQRGLVTTHPSSILRIPDEAARHEAFRSFVKDLREVAKFAI